MLSEIPESDDSIVTTESELINILMIILHFDDRRRRLKDFTRNIWIIDIPNVRVEADLILIGLELHLRVTGSNLVLAVRMPRNAGDLSFDFLI